MSMGEKRGVLLYRCVNGNVIIGEQRGVLLWVKERECECGVGELTYRTARNHEERRRGHIYVMVGEYGGRVQILYGRRGWGWYVW